MKHHCSMSKEIYQDKPFLGTPLRIKPFLGTPLRIEPNSRSQSPVLKSIFPLPLGGRATSLILPQINFCSLSRTNLIPFQGNLSPAIPFQS